LHRTDPGRGHCDCKAFFEQKCLTPEKALAKEANANPESPFYKEFLLISLF